MRLFKQREKRETKLREDFKEIWDRDFIFVDCAVPKNEGITSEYKLDTHHNILTITFKNIYDKTYQEKIYFNRVVPMKELKNSVVKLHTKFLYFIEEFRKCDNRIDMELFLYKFHNYENIKNEKVDKETIKYIQETINVDKEQYDVSVDRNMENGTYCIDVWVDDICFTYRDKDEVVSDLTKYFKNKK